MFRRTAVVVGLCAASVLVGGAAPARGQSSSTPASPARIPRIDVSVLGSVSTGGALTSSDAALVDNTTPAGGMATLFSTRARLAAAPAGEVRVGVRVVRGWVAEGGISYGRPSLEVRLADDAEASDVTATTRLTQLVVDGALVHRWRGRRMTPFVMGGAGYLRQLDEPRTTVGTGQVYAGGGGVLFGIGRARAGGVYALQARADVRVMSYHGGLPLVDERPVGVVAGVGVTVRIR